MPEKEIEILVLSPTILKIGIRRTTTVRQIQERLEKLGLKGYALAAEPSDFLYIPTERIFNKVLEGEVVYAFPEERELTKNSKREGLENGKETRS